MSNFLIIIRNLSLVFFCVCLGVSVANKYFPQQKPNATIGYITVCVSGLTFLQSQITGDLTQVFINNNNTLNCSVG